MVTLDSFRGRPRNEVWAIARDFKTDYNTLTVLVKSKDQKISKEAQNTLSRQREWTL